ncbi:hypothetical protein DFH27DRAFT_613324 [Peziza echinospora]|nr:hypothetical protein DFH27DRAFT_613324 [Peziza echinospora]
MPRASTSRPAPGFTLPTRPSVIFPDSEPIADARHILDQTNEYVVHAFNQSYPASIQPTNRTHHLYGYYFRSWFLSTGTWSSQVPCKVTTSSCWSTIKDKVQGPGRVEVKRLGASSAVYHAGSMHGISDSSIESDV